MCLFTLGLHTSVNKSYIPSLPQNNIYMKWIHATNPIINWLESIEIYYSTFHLPVLGKSE
jgi:hypothetical protein